jgi:hypothetical protein
VPPEGEERSDVMSQGNLNRAKEAKNDEFYTRLEDIEKEVKNYKDHFRGKVVYCNCDDPYVSNFVLYFSRNFEHLGLKKLIATCYRNTDASKRTHGVEATAVKIEYEGGAENSMPTMDDFIVTPLEGNGDFRSKECVELLKESDIVVTNPPFSLFRAYVVQLMEHKKSFLIIGTINAVTYKEIFPLIKDAHLWLGVNSNKTMEFALPDSYAKWSRIENGVKYGKVPGICWFTNLSHSKRNEGLGRLTEEYNPTDYPTYDNYDAIHVRKTNLIPKDYDGVMGVPITFLTKYSPAQFELLGSRRWSKSKELVDVYTGTKTAETDFKTLINGRETYDRIFIRRRRESVLESEVTKVDE